MSDIVRRNEKIVGTYKDVMRKNEVQSEQEEYAMSYLDLFLTFARIGVLTFGGGYAMLPIIQREIVEKKGWVTETEVMDYYAIGQCTPGVIAVNTATFTGRKIMGNLGGVVATAGVVFPSVVIITVIAALIHGFADLRPVQDALAGIRICVCVLIFNAVLKMWKKAVIDKVTLVLYLAILIASVFFNASPILMVVIAAVCGLIVKGRAKA